MLNDNFDTFDTSTWYVSDFAVAANWNQTAWDENYVLTPPGEVVLTFDGTDTSGKPYTGSEIQSNAFNGYGSYEVDMMPSGESGVVSSFFLFSNTFFGAARHNEIDFEFLGDDTTKVNINYYYGNEKLGDNGSVQVDLGFDAADAMHTYRIDWTPEAIRWYADDVLLYEVEETTAPLPIPDEPMKMYMSVWTGGEGLEHWHGPVDENASTEARYSAVRFTEYVPEAPTDGGVISFEGESDAYTIDLSSGTFARAARVMAQGDSLTVGVVDVNDPNALPTSELTGYRIKLFDQIVAGGGWIDYVGGTSSGQPDDLDTDHNALGGESLRNMVDNNDTSPVDFSAGLEANNPDIVLFMAGSNDFNGNNFFNNRFPALMSNMQDAIDQFYAYAGNAEKYLVISTVPPKTRSGTPEEYGPMLNEGYSTVNGQQVVGDAGNGTYVPGIRALVTAMQATHPTLILFDNPIGLDGLTTDNIHFSEESYTTYAQEMYDLLLTQIGQQAGTFGQLAGTLPSATDVVGGDAGDRITGDSNANRIEGGGGTDYLTGGAGGDVFAYGVSALDGRRDYIADFSSVDGDSFDLTEIAAFFGWDESEFASNVVTEDYGTGAILSVNGPSQTYQLAFVEGATAAEVLAATGIDLGADTSADVDGNLAVSAPDSDISQGEANSVEIVVSGIDGDATAVVTLSDGVNSVVSNALATDGSVFLDISGLTPGAITVSVTATDNAGNMATVGGSGLTLEEGDIGGGPTNQLLGTNGRDTLTDGDEATEILGLDDRDTLIGNGGDDLLDGGAGKDEYYGGAGADIFRIGVDGLDGNRDNFWDFSIAEGDRLDISLIAEYFGWTEAEARAALVLTDINPGLRVQLVTPEGNFTPALLHNVLKADFLAADPLILQAGPPPNTADDDGNMALAAPDAEITLGEESAVEVVLSGLDADATAVVSLTVNGTTFTQNASANGSVFFDLTGQASGTITTSVTATDAEGAESTVDGPSFTLDMSPPDTSADEDGNLAATAPDTEISVLEAGSVQIDVTGIDADATATVTATDGVNSVESSTLLADGSVFLDISGLNEGTIQFSVTATDDLGNVASVPGGSLTLDLSPPSDTSADEDGNLAVSAPDLQIAPEEADAVQVTVSGIDADATAVVTLSDGVNSVVSNALASDGSVFLDISGLTPGSISVSVTATDTTGNTATANGAALTLEEDEIVDPGNQLLGTNDRDNLVDGDGDTLIIGYDERDTLRGNGGNDILDGGAGKDDLYGGAGADIFRIGRDGLDAYRDNIWDFSIAEGDKLDISLVAEYFGWDETQARNALVLSDINPGMRVQFVTPEGNFTTAVLHGVSTANFLAADPLILQAGPPPNTADDDGNMALSAPDATITLGEQDAVEVVLSGLDADATAVVSLTVNGNTFTQNSGTNGSVFFDLTGQASGAITTSVTATDSEGAELTIGGPGMTLDMSGPDESADEDGNLAAVAPDSEITFTEASSVQVDVSGIDADATAVVTATDGVNSVDSGALSADGSVYLDISGLNEGSIQLSVTATDTTGNVAQVAGGSLTLDLTPPPPDTSADEDGNLAVTAPDAEITAPEAGSVQFNVTGIDADASAVVTVTDGVNSVQSGVLAGDGSAFVNVTGLSDGTLTYSVTATDTTGNIADVAGGSITLDTSVSIPTLYGTEGDDRIRDGHGRSQIFGLGGNDDLIGNGNDDLLYGGAGNDFLRGDDGNDVLDGGSGYNKLRGGAGADTFVFSLESLDGNYNRLYDFSEAEGDILDFRAIVSGFGWTEAEAQSYTSWVTDGSGIAVLIDSPDADQPLIVMDGLTVNDLDYSNFIFV